MKSCLLLSNVSALIQQIRAKIPNFNELWNIARAPCIITKLMPSSTYSKSWKWLLLEDYSFALLGLFSSSTFMHITTLSTSLYASKIEGQGNVELWPPLLNQSLTHSIHTIAFEIWPDKLTKSARSQSQAE